MGRKKSKIRGKKSKRIPKEKSEKMEKTIEKMQKMRQEDSVYLRDLLNQKLTWAISEKQKAQTNIEKLKIQAHRLEGAIIFIKDVLAEREEKE